MDEQDKEKIAQLEQKINDFAIKNQQIEDFVNKLWSLKLETSETHIYWTDSAGTKHQLDN